MRALPIIALVGRPNVGKSTLFNALTKSRAAIVDDFPGLTRDRQYGIGKVGNQPYWLIDTGGIAEATHESAIEAPLEAQAAQAMQESDHIFFIVDHDVGVTQGDTVIAKALQQHRDKVTIIVNKADHEDLSAACSDFYALAFASVCGISAKRQRGLKDLINDTLGLAPEQSESQPESEQADKAITVALIGRPNVGKSTLTNALLGDERVVVSDIPGTTRDAIDVPFTHHETQYTLIDTAGVRRRTKIQMSVEKDSIGKTLLAIDRADVIIMVMDARERITDQDCRLIGLVLKRGRGLVFAFNKWDGLSEHEREQTKANIDRRLEFADFARRYTISALHGTGVGNLFHAIKEAYRSIYQPFSTSMLTDILNQALCDHQPPLVSGRRIKLRYAHLGGQHPLIIIIHGKQTQNIPGSYQRYLVNYFRKACNIVGVPLLLRFKTDDNPYTEKKQVP